MRLARAALVFCAALLPHSAARAAEKKPAPAPKPAAAAAPAVDAAAEAYQRGDFSAALAEAKKRAAADPKDAAALLLIGRLHIEGAGVPRNVGEGLDWFRKAADAGSTDAAFRYGAAKLVGVDTAQDDKTARAYLEKAAMAGHGGAYNLLGEMALNAAEPNFAAAGDMFRKAASIGDPDAPYALGMLYKNGKGVAADAKTAVEWFTRAAGAGHTAAMVELAVAEFNGKGVERDRDTAIKWFRAAAERGNAVAQNRLAQILARGMGTPISLGEAAYWRDRAKKAGLNDADLDLLIGETAPTAPAPPREAAPRGASQKAP
jgi:uncharacterized protein